MGSEDVLKIKRKPRGSIESYYFFSFRIWVGEWGSTRGQTRMWPVDWNTKWVIRSLAGDWVSLWQGSSISHSHCEDPSDSRQLHSIRRKGTVEMREITVAPLSTTNLFSQEHYMEFMNAFVEHEWQHMEDFLNKISRRYGSPLIRDTVVIIDWTTRPHLNQCSL